MPHQLVSTLIQGSFRPVGHLRIPRSFSKLMRASCLIGSFQHHLFYWILLIFLHSIFCGITTSCPCLTMVSRHLSFVNISRPDEGQSKRTKAFVRRHVMADVGRSRRKKARYKIIPLQVAATNTSSATMPANAAAAESTPLVRMPPSFQTFLIGNDARASDLITFSQWS